MIETVKQDAKSRMEKAISNLKKELATIRTGRANPAMLDKVHVEYYGADTPLNQMANVSTPDPRTLMIQAWDKSALSDIERAISKADLGLVPSSDGVVIRINIPPLTEDRRKELVKVAKKIGEESKVAIRNVRRDANDEMKKLEKSGDVSEDDARRSQEEIQKITDKFIEEIDSIVNTKEKEILEV